MTILRSFIALVCLFTLAQPSVAQTPEPAKKPKQFIYVLRLVPRLHSDSAWTKEDNMAIERHFTRFKLAIEKGELILAGRTMEPGDKTFGIAIFEAAGRKGCSSVHGERSRRRRRVDDRGTASVCRGPSAQEPIAGGGNRGTFDSIFFARRVRWISGRIRA